jgi:hypothetical protein
MNTTLTYIISKKIDHEISFRKTEQEWKELERYRILRQKEQNTPHTGTYNLHYEKNLLLWCVRTLFESNLNLMHIVVFI